MNNSQSQFSHYVSTSEDDTMYKIEFYFEGCEVKTVYINADSIYAPKQIIKELSDFYTSIPTFMKQWGYHFDEDLGRWIK